MNREGFLRVLARLFPGAELTAAERLTGGVSADVHRLDLTLGDGRSTSIVLRAHGGSHAGHGAELEYQLLKALHRRGVPVPEPLLCDVTGTLLENPFLAMTFVDGHSSMPAGSEFAHIDAMADALRNLHTLPTAGLPALPARTDPLPEMFDLLPDGPQWEALRARLRDLGDTAYRQSPRLLHGDFWPENLLWEDGRLAAILDWEDAAFGDPLSDVACTRVELRYRFGTAGMRRFTRAYARHGRIDQRRLALWQVYVAAAAQHFMGRWGLEPAREDHMRREALASLREAGAVLFQETAP